MPDFPILSISATSMPDRELIRKTAANMGISERDFYARYAPVPEVSRMAEIMSLAGFPTEPHRLPEAWSPHFGRIVSLGVSLLLPGQDGSPFLVRRALSGSNEPFILSQFATLFCRALSQPIQDPYPVIVSSAPRSVLGNIIARLEFFCNTDRIPEIREKDVRTFLQTWYDTSDKWGDRKPNYMMDRDRHLCDVRYLGAGGAWSGPAELQLAAIGFVLGMDPSKFAAGRDMTPDRYWDAVVRRDLCLSGQNLAVYALHRKRLGDPDMMEVLERPMKVLPPNGKLPHTKEEVLAADEAGAGNILAQKFGDLPHVSFFDRPDFSPAPPDREKKTGPEHPVPEPVSL